MRPGSLTARVWEAFDALMWIAALNFAWLLFTLLGGVAFGLAPSTVTASTLVRRRARGDVVRPFTEFWAVYRAEFIRANALLLPVGLAMAGLLLSWQYFSRGDDMFSMVLSSLAIVLLAFCAAAAAVLVPLYCSYELPLRSYAPAALSFTLVNPLLLVLSLATVAGVLALCWVLPGIVPFFSAGLLIYLTTLLSLDFFARNERRRAASAASPLSLAASPSTEASSHQWR
jgi:uncharacterized membrane protein YesL